MGFIMPVCLKKPKWILGGLLFLTPIARADDYQSVINSVSFELHEGRYFLNADIKFHLSPIALEALHKGIPLNWMLQVKFQQRDGFWGLWPKTIQHRKLQFEIRNHPLMNMYSVQKSFAPGKDVFSSFTAALAAVAKIRDVELISSAELIPNQAYQVAVKLHFEHEALPVPLRPMSYFNRDWQLSSVWSRWPLSD